MMRKMTPHYYLHTRTLHTTPQASMPEKYYIIILSILIPILRVEKITQGLTRILSEYEYDIARETYSAAIGFNTELFWSFCGIDDVLSMRKSGISIYFESSGSSSLPPRSSQEAGSDARSRPRHSIITPPPACIFFDDTTSPIIIASA